MRDPRGQDGTRRWSAAASYDEALGYLFAVGRQSGFLCSAEYYVLVSTGLTNFLGSELSTQEFGGNSWVVGDIGDSAGDWID